MWYFTWILGTSLALLLAIATALQYEAREYAAKNLEEDRS